MLDNICYRKKNLILETVREWSYTHVMILNLVRWISFQQNCGLRMRRECQERFTRQRFQSLVSDPGVRDARAVIHVGIANPQWHGIRFRYPHRNPKFCVSDKRPKMQRRLHVQSWMSMTWCQWSWSRMNSNDRQTQILKYIISLRNKNAFCDPRRFRFQEKKITNLYK